MNTVVAGPSRRQIQTPARAISPAMYAVVGCNECGGLWLLSDPGETATCPTCGKRHQTRKLKRFYESDDREAARQARAAMLADKRGAGEAFDALDSVAEMERLVDDADAVDDREYLESAGLDPDAVNAAGEAAGPGGSGGSKSRREIVEAGLRAGDRPTEDEVVAYAAERGVPPDAARTLLEKLARRGAVSESDGRYRLL